jgi:outer membrane biosynthesis protein TonB
MKKKLTEEERFGVVFTSIVNTIIIILTLLIYASGLPEERSALIEITLGEFRDGTTAQFNPTRNPEVATRRNPSNVPTPQPQERQNIVERPVERRVEPVKEVELPKQEEVIREETVNTPITEKIDPTKTTEEVSPEVVRVQQRAERAEIEREGAESTGDVRGVRGRVDADQGTGIDPVRAAPYQLEWEGNIQRSPLVQPLPSYPVEAEAVITIRFEVRPDGTVGRIQPIRRMNPELEAEVTRTLRSWRFSRLPANAPQDSQFGVITFRFVLN